MVYAVAMNTIQHFERSLGRPVLWRPQINPNNEFDDSQFVRRLSLRPHALRQANAFYSPQDIALLFGYFEAGAEAPPAPVSSRQVFSRLSPALWAHPRTHTRY